VSDRSKYEREVLVELRLIRNALLMLVGWIVAAVLVYSGTSDLQQLPLWERISYFASGGMLGWMATVYLKAVSD
jgi:uncharacterized membrane protein YhdT